MRLSIITSSFNGATYLPQCLESVREQRSEDGGRRSEGGGRRSACGGVGKCKGTKVRKYESGKVEKSEIRFCQRSAAGGAEWESGKVEKWEAEKPSNVPTFKHSHSDGLGISVEHIVVDAASKDGSVELLEEWLQRSEDGRRLRKYSRVQARSEVRGEEENQKSEVGGQRSESGGNYSFRFISEPDRGQSEGFNKGVAMATGDWICWLNADDELAPGALDAFFRAVEAEPDLDLVYGHVEFIDEESKPLRTCYTLPYIHGMIRGNVWLPPSSGTYFRRDLLVKEPLDADYHFVMDVEWFIRAGRGLKARRLDRVMSRFRISAQGKTSEMVTSGKITDRHHEEREEYRRKYLYGCLGDGRLGRLIFNTKRLFWLGVYYGLKMQFVQRYVKERRRAEGGGRRAEGSPDLDVVSSAKTGDSISSGSRKAGRTEGKRI